MSSIFQLGEAAKLKPLEVELKRLEELSEAIVQDFSLMRKREEEMRDTNGTLNKYKYNSYLMFFFLFIMHLNEIFFSFFLESTNSRVLYFSIFSMCCLLGLATWQVLYLRKFFKAKKLIE